MLDWLAFGLPGLCAGGVFGVINEFGAGLANPFRRAGWLLAWLLGGALLSLFQAVSLRSWLHGPWWVLASTAGWLAAWMIAASSGRTVELFASES